MSRPPQNRPLSPHADSTGPHTAEPAPWLRATADVLPALVLALLLLLVLAPWRSAGAAPPSAPQAAPPVADPALVEQGRRLYEEGVLPGGEPLRAERLGAAPLRGKVAACVSCHRRSGMGSIEGNTIIPPITGLALHAGLALRDRVVASMDPRRGRSWNQSHAPYDEAALLAALASGLHVSGRTMDPLMPRYAVGLPEVHALSAYLDQLSATWSVGATADVVRLATVITPGVSPRRREAFLQTLRGAVDQKNSNTMPGHRHMINAAEMVMRIERSWELEVWELQGSPDTWGAQLDEHYRQSPVFALASGLGEGTWEPVQAFCERSHVPCWFPSVAVAPAHADEQFYGLYFSQGLPLEAQVIAMGIARDPHLPGALTGKAAPHRVVQVLRAGEAARAAALALQQSLPAGTRVEQHVLDAGPLPAADALAPLWAGLGAADALVLWLEDPDLRALAGLAPPAAPVYLSGTMAHDGLAALPPGWAPGARMAYPYELPEARIANLATFNSWIATRGIPLVDEAMQSEVFFSINYLQYTLSEMLDNIYRDYLIERGESMLRRRELQRAEEETFMRQQGHPPAKRIAARATLTAGPIFGTDPQGPLSQGHTPAIGVRQGTTIYPRLSLAPGQRYASKGAYLVRLGGEDGHQLVADAGWLVP